MEFKVIKNYDLCWGLYDPYFGTHEGDDLYPSTRHDGYLVEDESDDSVEYISHEQMKKLESAGVRFSFAKAGSSSQHQLGGGVRIYEKPHVLARVTSKSSPDKSVLIKMALFGGRNTCFYVRSWDGSLSCSLNNDFEGQVGAADDDNDTFDVYVNGRSVSSCYFIITEGTGIRFTDDEDIEPTVTRVATMFFERGETHPEDMDLGYETYEPRYDIGYPVTSSYYKYLLKLRFEDRKDAFLMALSPDLLPDCLEQILSQYDVEWV